MKSFFRPGKPFRKALLLLLISAGLSSLVTGQEARWKQLMAQVRELYSSGRYAEGIPLAQQAVQVAQATYGVEHRNSALSLGYLGLMYQHHGDYALAEAAMRRALAVDEKVLGPANPEVATCLNNLAELLDDEGKYSDAEAMYKRALAIDEKALGPNDPAVAPDVNNLAAVYEEEGRYDEAEQLYKRALAIVEKALGPADLRMAKSMNNLAGLYEQEGRYAEAEALYQRSMEITLKAAEVPDDLATGLNNLALLYVTEGAYAAAEPYYKQSLAITEKALGPDHPDVAVGLNNLASLYLDQGRYGEAEPLLKRSLAIRQKALGPDHPAVATAMNNLAALYEDQGRYAEAERLYKSSLAIREKAFGPDHLDVAASLNNLAQLYNDVGNNVLAEPLLKRSLMIVENVSGPDHPDLAKNLNNLGAVYKDEGKYAEAEPLYKRALAIDEKAFGPDHLATATDLNNLALLYYAQNNATQAEAFFERGLQSLFNQFENSFTYMSERDRLQFQDAVHFNIDIYLGFCFTHVREQPALAGRIYDVLLWEKGLVGSSVTALRARVAASGDPQALRIFDQLAVKKNLSARLASTHPEGWQESRKKVDAEANDLEQELARRVSHFSDNGARAPTTWRDVQKKLQPGEAAVEFVRFAYHDGKKWTGKSLYAALVTTPDRHDAPAVFPLGDAKDLEGDPLVSYRRSVGLHHNVALRGVETSEEEEQPAAGPTMTTFYNAFWKPMEPALTGVERIYLSPDGVLNQIALGAVSAGDGHLLLEKYDLRIVSSTRDLCGEPRKYFTHSAVLMGNPSFDLSEAQQRSALGSLRGVKPAVMQDKVEIAGAQFRDFTGGTLKPLPGTQAELQAVSSILEKQHWSVQMFTQQEALKEALLEVKAPQVLHLATHGFFDPDRQKGEARHKTNEQQPSLEEDPMLRSGLFFAGANRRLSGQTVRPDLDDGVLTAYEASLLNLQGTELVVLSACDTGLGVVAAGEGIFGLRRAFQVAGAQSILMSMWSVPDHETQELMALFYQKRLSGEDKHQALREAQLEMRERVRARYGRDLPEYWGAFVLVGP